MSWRTVDTSGSKRTNLKIEEFAFLNRLRILSEGEVRASLANPKSALSKWFSSLGLDENSCSLTIFQCTTKTVYYGGHPTFQYSFSGAKPDESLLVKFEGNPQKPSFECLKAAAAVANGTSSGKVRINLGRTKCA